MAAIKQHGEDAQVHAIKRMRYFATEGDDAGMRFWIDISRRIHDLTKTAGSTEH
jgi:hypothetical protein